MFLFDLQWRKYKRWRFFLFSFFFFLNPILLFYDIWFSSLCAFLSFWALALVGFLLLHHHHHVVPLARISLTLSRHFSLSFIASCRSSGLYSVSSLSCWMYVRAGRRSFARSYVGVHRSTSLMRSSLLLQQCPACLVRLTLIVFVTGGRWPYSWCLVGCGRQDLFNIARSILLFLVVNTRRHEALWFWGRGRERSCFNYIFYGEPS